MHELLFTTAQVDLEDAEGLTPLMHGLLAVRSSMDSESAVRAVSVLAQHSKPGSLQSQQDGVGTVAVWILFGYNLVFLPCSTSFLIPNHIPPHPTGQLGSGGQTQAYQPIRVDSCSPRRSSPRREELAGAAGRPQRCRAWHWRDASAGSANSRGQGIECS